MDNRKGCNWVRNRNNEGRCNRFVKAEKSEEWMARSPVWPDDVIASETASRHQPMNRAPYMGSDSVTRKAFPMRKAKLRSVELPMKENWDFWNAADPILVWKLFQCKRTKTKTFGFWKWCHGCPHSDCVSLMTVVNNNIMLIIVPIDMYR